MLNQKRIIALILTVMILALVVVSRNTPVYADPLTATIIGGVSYALATDWGISFTSAMSTSSGMSGWITGQVEEYVNSHGGSITALFGTEVAKAQLGKLAVGYQLYNGVKSFVNWLKEKFGISGQLNADFEGDSLPYDGQAESSIIGVGIEVSFIGSGVGGSATEVKGYYNGVRKFDRTRQNLRGGIDKTYRVLIQNQEIYCEIYQLDSDGARIRTESFLMVSEPEFTEMLSWDTSGYVEPTVLNPDQEWTGTIGGQAIPDTNLEQLLQEIFAGITQSDLLVDGEIVEPGPSPTPVPTIAPDTPLSDVPWEGLGPDIGDIADTTGDIADTTGEIAESLEGVAEGVDSISEALTDALDIPTEAEAESAKFDLRNLFPFCIPFDIYRFLQMFDADPVAPHVRIPFVIDSLNFSYMIDMDFAAWSPLAAILRAAELIAYGIGLAWATSKVIKW